MPGLRDLKRRIKSIQSTRKITRAMQMVSAAKMRKAQTAALNSRTYSELAGELIGNMSSVIARSDRDEAILNKDRFAALAMTKTYPNATKTGVIIVSTNKGLVGGFNTNLLNELRKVENQDFVGELLVMGKKAKDFAVRFNKNLVADFPKADNWQPITSIYPLAKAVANLYETGEYKQILIIYNKFVSTLVQKATVKQLLPFEGGERSGKSEAPQLTPNPLPLTSSPTDYLFEPTPETVLNHLIPRIIESQIYQAVLESNASEHSARMVMMKNATEAAGDLIADYTLTYNQLRQNKITTELAEITAGKIALE